jgi:hypothetical protein
VLITHETRISLAMMAPWLTAPPTSITRPAAQTHNRDPAWIRGRAHEDLAGLERLARAGVENDPNDSLRDARRGGQPRDNAGILLGLVGVGREGLGLAPAHIGKTDVVVSGAGRSSLLDQGLGVRR